MEPTQAAEPTQQSSSSWWEDPIDVIFSPTELFERRRDARIGPPLLLLLAASVVVYLIMMPVNEIVMRAATAQDPNAAAAMERFGTAFRLVGAIFMPIGVAIGLAWSALLLFGFGRLFDIPTSFKRAFLIATYAGWIFLLAQLAGGLLLLILGGDDVTDLMAAVSFGVLRFTGSEDMAPTLVPLVGRLEVFVIWGAVIWAIGLRVVHGASRGQAIGTAAAVWVLSALPQIVMAALRPTP
jgi:hypothetical protein